jgi:hypothetical protein
MMGEADGRYPRDHVEGYYQDCYLRSILIVKP